MTDFRDGWSPSLTDSSSNVTGGFIFTAGQNIRITALRAYKSPTGTPPASVPCKLWTPAPGPTEVAAGTVDLSGVSGGNWGSVSITPYSLAASGSLVIGGYFASGTTSRYNQDYVADITDGVITYPANVGGRYLGGGSIAYPSTTWNGMHGVGFTYTLADAEQGAAELAVNVDLTATGLRISRAGAVALGVDVGGVPAGLLVPQGSALANVSVALSASAGRVAQAAAVLAVSAGLAAVLPADLHSLPGRLLAGGAAPGLLARGNTTQLTARGGYGA